MTCEFDFVHDLNEELSYIGPQLAISDIIQCCYMADLNTQLFLLPPPDTHPGIFLEAFTQSCVSNRTRTGCRRTLPTTANEVEPLPPRSKRRNRSAPAPRSRNHTRRTRFIRQPRTRGTFN